jgi:hypothetical protein
MDDYISIELLLQLYEEGDISKESLVNSYNDTMKRYTKQGSKFYAKLAPIK